MGVTDPWTSPDRTAARGTSATVLPGSAGDAPSVRGYAAAALCVAAGVVLLAAPLGLLWSAVAPHAEVVVLAKEQAGFAMPEREDFIGSDGSFLGLTLLAGLLCGLVAWRTARRWGPTVVVAVVVASLGASLIAAEVGTRVGRTDFQAAIAAGTPPSLTANVKLMADQVHVGWPIGALIGFVGPLLYWRDSSL